LKDQSNSFTKKETVSVLPVHFATVVLPELLFLPVFIE